MRGSQSAVPSPVSDRLDDMDPPTSSSIPVAWKLASAIDAQNASIGREQRENATSSKPESREMKPSLASVSEEHNGDLVQNGLEHAQQSADAPVKAQRPTQQRANGLTNRHLSEEDNAEDAKHQRDDNVSEGGDGEETDDEEDDEEEDEAAGNNYLVSCECSYTAVAGPDDAQLPWSWP